MEEIASLPMENDCFEPTMDDAQRMTCGNDGGLAIARARMQTQRLAGRKCDTESKMLTIHSYPIAVMLLRPDHDLLGFVGQHAKLAARSWRFELFYWDFVAAFRSLLWLFALTIGSAGHDRAALHYRFVAG